MQRRQCIGQATPIMLRTLHWRAIYRLRSFRSNVDGFAVGGSGCAHARVVHGAGGAAVAVRVENAMTFVYPRARPAHDRAGLPVLIVSDPFSFTPNLKGGYENEQYAWIHS